MTSKLANPAEMRRHNHSFWGILQSSWLKYTKYSYQRCFAEKELCAAEKGVDKNDDTDPDPYIISYTNW